MVPVCADIQFFAAKSLHEALSIRESEGDKLTVIAGGTDVMVAQGAHKTPLPSGYLSIWGIEELRGIHVTPEGLHIGPLTTYSELLLSKDIRDLLPSLAEASRWVGATQIQNRGTVGGNVMNASPAGDALPVLAAADAVLIVSSLARGERHVPFHSFYTGYRKTVVASDELLVGIHVPRPARGTRTAFAKVGSRRAQTISKVMAACQAILNKEGRIEAIALAYGSVAPTVVRVPETERALLGEKVSAGLADQVASILKTEIFPITDVRSTRDYRQFVAVGLLRRFFRNWS